METLGAWGGGTIRGLVAACIVLILAAVPFSGYGQTSTGTLKGTVVDKDGEKLPGVTVTLSSEQLGIKDQGTITDANGQFKIIGLPPGTDYKLQVVFPGYQKIIVPIEIKANRTIVHNLTLRPDTELKEEIVVTTKAEVVDQERRDTSTSFSDDFIEGLPVIGREYVDVLTLAPGVQDEDGDGNVNILGSRDRDVLISMDGVNVTDPFTGQDALDVNLETVGEIELVRAGAGAEYGGKSGGFVNLITKSGSNEFEGSFKFFLRTDIFDGDGAGTDPPAFHGGIGEAEGFRDLSFDEYRPFLSVGGPIIRDRLWYFISNQFNSIDEPINAASQVFVTNRESFREFAKLTWQANSAVKPALSLSYNPTELRNQGLTSLTTPDNAFDVNQRRSIVSLDVPWIVSSRVLLESTLSFDNGWEERLGVVNADFNNNGIGFRRPVTQNDRDTGICQPGQPGNPCADGFLTDVEVPTAFFGPKFRDYGEDFNGNGIIDPPPSGFEEQLTGLCIQDGDGKYICEGDGIYDVSGPAGVPDGRIDNFDKDGILEGPDGDTVFNVAFNTQSGPYRFNWVDLKRDRTSLRSMSTIEVDDFFGNHVVKLGGNFESEDFLRDRTERAFLSVNVNPGAGSGGALQGGVISAFVPVPGRVPDLSATSDTLALFADDRYKPLQNLTVGVGFRFDREEINTSGFTHFDPVAEAILFQRVGRDILAQKGGLIHTDPILGDAREESYITKLTRAAVNQFTAHHQVTSFDADSPFIEIRRDDRLAGGADANSQKPEDFTITNNNLAPRLSFSWDPWSDGKTKIYSTFGRYYDRIFLEAVVQEEFPSLINKDYSLDQDFIGSDGLFNRGFGRTLRTSPPNTTQVARDLQSPYNDEFTFGVERELSPELALSATYITRKWERQLQDQDINHTIQHGKDLEGGLVCNPDGTECQRKADGLPDLNILNLFFNQILLVGNFNKSTFEAIELELTRRLHRKWQMEASYTYSKAEGAAEDFATESGDDPSTTENEFGYLLFDQRHSAKFSATTFLPKDIALGGFVTWASGYPWSLIQRTTSRDNKGYVQFRRRFPTGARNDQRNDTIWNFGISLRKNFVVGKISAAAQMQVEDFLNTDDLRVFEVNDISFSNQVTAQREFGRRWEFGLVLNF